MKKMALVFLVILTIILSLIYFDNDEESMFVVGQEDSENRDKFIPILNEIDHWVDTGEIVGAEIIVIEDREIIAHEVYGWMDKEAEKPMKENTIFRIRSMTKPFIATSILLLEEEGKLEFSDKVSKYLPSFNNDLSGLVTIEQLLTHTGGFEGLPENYEIYNTLREVVDTLGENGPSIYPGERYVYSDAGVAILGAVISQISGISVEEFIDRKILEPLEMRDTFCSLGDGNAIRDRISATYYKDGNEYIKYWDSSKPQAVNYFRASGGMYSTPKDYAKFLYMWLNKGRIESKQFLKEETIVNALTPSSLNNNYGYLWETGHYFGHGGSDGTIAFALPKENIMVLYFTQSRATHTTEIVKFMVLEAFGLNENKTYTKTELEPEIYNEYVGKYENSQVEIAVTTDGVSLQLKTIDSSNQLFFSAYKDFFFHEILDIQLSFLRDTKGEVFGVVIYQKGELIELSKVE